MDLFKESAGHLTQLICSEVAKNRSLSEQEFEELWEMVLPCDYLFSGGWIRKLKEAPESLEAIFDEVIRAPKDPLFSLEQKGVKTKVYNLLKEARTDPRK